jgi:hypothetical protein
MGTYSKYSCSGGLFHLGVRKIKIESEKGGAGSLFLLFFPPLSFATLSKGEICQMSTINFFPISTS